MTNNYPDRAVENGELIGTPVATGARTGWAEAASAVAVEGEEEAAWRGFANEDDRDLTW